MSRRFCRATDLTSFTAAAPVAGDIGKVLYVSAAGTVSYTSGLFTDGTYLQIGATAAVPSSGQIRVTDTFSIKSNDASANTMQVFGVASGKITLGENSWTTGIDYRCASTYSHLFYVNNTIAAQLSATALKLRPSGAAAAGSGQLQGPATFKMYGIASGADTLMIGLESNILTIGQASNLTGIQYQLPGSTTHSFFVGGAAALTVGAGYLTVGAVASAAGAGTLRLANGTSLYARNAAGTQNVLVTSLSVSDFLLIGDSNAAGITLTTAGNVTLAPGLSVNVQGPLRLGTGSIATAGKIRGEVDFSIYAIDGSSQNVPIVTMSSGAITFGGNTYAAGIAYRTKDATAHTFYVNNIVKLTANATGLGLYTATPVAQAADPGALTDSTGGSVEGTLSAISGSGADTDINNNFAELAAKVNAIRTALSAGAGGIGITA